MAEENNLLEEFKDFNNELEEKILEANKDETKIKWRDLLPELMAAEIFIIGNFSEQTNALGDKLINILMIQKDGRTFVPFFTSPKHISAIVTKDKNSFDVLKVNTVRFFLSVMGKPSVMNPLTPYVRVFSPFDMKVLAAENLDCAAQTEEEKAREAAVKAAAAEKAGE